MNPHDSFSQFSHFPTEIRRLVWMFCLPRRIAEEDFPYTLLDGQESRQACWPNRTIYQNARVPLLSTVCLEARAVVFEWGMHKVTQDHTSLATIWVQPKIDLALHLNWTRRRNDEFFMVNNEYPDVYDRTPINDLIANARFAYGMRISLVGDVFWPFDLAALVDLPQTSESNAVRAALPSPDMPVNDEYEHGRAFDLYDIIGGVQDHSAGFPKAILYTTLVAISLHVNRARALASGLFGLLGDAPVQTVDYNDVPRLRQFYELFNSDPNMKDIEPHVTKLFDAILRPEFHAAVLAWQKSARWLLQVALWKWYRTREDIRGTFGSTGPFVIWTPPIPREQRYIRMSEFMPNEEYPWWGKYTEEHVPTVVPQVMIRLCDNQCFREERRPEMFGKVWFADPPLGRLEGHASRSIRINERGWMVSLDN